MTKNFFRSSLQNASWNIMLQVSSRLITFVLNAYVVRVVSQDAIGVMYVRLLLLESTILFLSRDGFRKACLSKTADHNWPKVINLVWLTVPLSILLCSIFGYIWYYVLTPPNPDVTQHYGIGVLAILISCVIEMCCEQLYLISQAFLFLKLRVFADVFSLLMRTITFVLLLSPENAVLAFSVAQILCLVLYVSIFYGYFLYYIRKYNSDKNRRDSTSEFPFHSVADLLPKYLKNEEQIDYKLLVLVYNFLKQGVMMQVLSEGERYVMTLMNVLSFAEQGIFDVVNNLGSLTARFLFRPIEESAYFYFSQLIHRDEEINRQDKKSMNEAAFVLENLLRCVTTLGLLVFCFGQSYAQLVLFLYGGKTLAIGLGPRLLRTHCLAILLMAVNGSTEAYLLSTINASELNKHNKLMVVFSAIFLFVAWIFSYALGSVGFILANCCNMSLRIFNSTRFIRKRYKNTTYRPLRGLLPKKYFLLVLVICSIVTQASEIYLFDGAIVLHFLIGAVCFCITLFTWYYQERNFIQFCVQNWKIKQQ